MTYWTRTGHDISTDLKRLHFEPDNTFKGQTIYAQAMWKIGEWLKGNYGDDYIT